MRIALVTREYPPETNWGGIGSFYYSLSQALKKAGCDVEIFTQGIYKPTSENINGILIHKVLPKRWILGNRPGGDLAGNKHLGIFSVSLAIEFLNSFSKRHNENPFDLVEAHEHLGVNALINKWHKRDLVTITRYHTSSHSLVRRNLVNWQTSKIVQVLEKLSIFSAKYRISTSKFIDGITCIDFPGAPQADAVIPNYISNDISNSNADYHTKDALLLFAGRMMPGHKNPDMAAQAFTRLADRFPNWRIEFAGLDIKIGPSETMWQRCEKILMPYKGRFQYHGVLSRHEIKELFLKAAILVVPSKFESFGLVALEAMSAGCIPVVTDNTALPEVVGDTGVIFKNGSLDDLIIKLESLMSSDTDMKLKALQCRRRKDELFSEDRITSQNINFYQKAINAFHKTQSRSKK